MCTQALPAGPPLSTSRGLPPLRGETAPVGRLRPGPAARLSPSLAAAAPPAPPARPSGRRGLRRWPTARGMQEEGALQLLQLGIAWQACGGDARHRGRLSAGRRQVQGAQTARSRCLIARCLLHAAGSTIRVAPPSSSSAPVRRPPPPAPRLPLAPAAPLPPPSCRSRPLRLEREGALGSRNTNPFSR